MFIQPLFSVLSLRYWSVAGPSYLCVMVVMLVLFYFASNLLLVPSLENPNTLIGQH